MSTEPLSLGFAFGAGMATFFAPCAYPLLPGYVSFFLGWDADAPPTAWARLRRATVVGSLVSLGFVLVYGILAGTALAVGTTVLRDIAFLEVIVGVVLIALGVGMATDRFTVARMPVSLPRRRRTASGFFAFGIVYAVAAAGCTAPLFVGIAGVALASDPSTAVLMLAAYAGGMSTLMLALTGLLALGEGAILGRMTHRTGTIHRVAGILLAGAGVAQIYLYVFGFDWLGALRLL